MAGGRTDATVHVDGHRVGLTNLSKVMYPAAGLVKADVIDYYAAVSAVMLPHVSGRPVTRKRWPDGVQAQAFFEKNLGQGVPSWVRRRSQQHSDRVVDYPLVDSVATLVWLAQLAALELHVPQWFYGARGRAENPDRLVFDLDPGPGTGLADCAMVARSVRDTLGRHGSKLIPVTSGSKGLHLYLGLNGSMTSDEASDWAHRLARSVERSMPDLVVSRMSRSLRAERVLIDWSQNNGSKTTIAPYSLRGRERPMVAAPRRWEELDDPELAQLDFREVLDRIDDIGDPMASLGRSVGGRRTVASRRKAAREAVHALRDAAHQVGVTPAGGTPDRATVDGGDSLDRPAGDGASGGVAEGARVGAIGDAAVDTAGDGAAGRSADRPSSTDPADRLATYRSKRSAARTPEPVPDAGALPHGDDDTFVIQEHHARRLHWDFRLERGGVLVSWAVPKGLPTDTRQNRLAVQTEDHPLEYASFAGSIPKGEYGGGEVTIWDAGAYRTEKWRDDEIIVVLRGRRAQGRYVLVRTGDSNWLMHRMKDQSGTDVAGPDGGADSQDTGRAGQRTGGPGAPGHPDRSHPDGPDRHRGRAGKAGSRESRSGGSRSGESRSGGSRSGGSRSGGSRSGGSRSGGSRSGGSSSGESRSDRTRSDSGDSDGARPSADGAEGRLPLPSGRARLPRDLAPMLASPGEVGGLGDGVWRIEGKWDGIRAIAELDHGELQVHSRAGNDLTSGYPELAELAEQLSDHSAVLDGEIVAMSENGVPSFELLQQRMGLTRPGEVRAAATRVPAHYYLFDLLYLDGVALLGKTYDDRRRLLEALRVRTEHCRVPAQLAGSPAEALEESRSRSLEGIVAKRADSTYRPGRRSAAWIKVKLWATQDVVVVGWRPGQGRRAGGIGSLLMALPREPGGDSDEALVYAGRVGTGFTDAMLDRLLKTLKPLQRKTSPVARTVPAADARDAVWVTPALVGEVSYSEITRDGRLRQPAWRGLREDVPVDQVRREW